MASGMNKLDADFLMAKEVEWLTRWPNRWTSQRRRPVLKAKEAEMMNDMERMEEMEEMAPGMRDGGMNDQMAEQTYMSEREVGGLMKKERKGLTKQT